MTKESCGSLWESKQLSATGCCVLCPHYGPRLQGTSGRSVDPGQTLVLHQACVGIIVPEVCSGKKTYRKDLVLLRWRMIRQRNEASLGTGRLPRYGVCTVHRTKIGLEVFQHRHPGNKPSGPGPLVSKSSSVDARCF